MNKAQLKLLGEVLHEAKDAYYNTGRTLKIAKTNPAYAFLSELLGTNRTITITDDVYDTLEDIFKKAGGKVGVGAAVTKTKCKLPFEMHSLDKAYAGDGALDKFKLRNKGPYVASIKLDGVSLQFDNTHGTPKLYTRGDGIIGQDVTYLLPHLNIPSIKATIACRGEVIMPQAVFDAKWSSKFKNARNLTSGLVNRKSIHEAVADLKFVVHELLSPRLAPSEAFRKLKQLGFTVVPHTVVDSITDASLESMLTKQRKQSKYAIDGIVVTQDSKKPLADANPSYAIAFKSNEGNSSTVEVVSVTWDESKHGLLKPTVQIKPTKLAGVTVTNATAHHAKYIVENGIGPGAVITIVRSGEVIPYITGVVKKVKPALPSVKEFGKYEWDKSKTNLVLQAPTDNKRVVTKQIASFFVSGLGTENIDLGTINILYDASYNTINSLLNIKSATELLDIPGIGQRKAKMIYEQISSKMKQADFANVAANSGFFGRNFGSKRMQAIADAYPMFKAFVGMKPQSIAEKVASLRGFSSVTAEQFAAGCNDFLKWVAKTPIKFAAPKKVAVVGKKMANQVVVFTGVRDKSMEEWIVANGGSIGSGVNSKTTLLIVKSLDSGSSKMEKAKELGIKILPIAKFQSMYM